MNTLKKLLSTTLKLAVVVGLIGAGYYAYLQYSVEAEAEDLGVLSTVSAEVRDITVAVSATGVLQPVKIVEIKSKASGEILEMPVEQGDFLQVGDLIAQVDTRILDQELKQADADFESARIRLDIARRQYDRARSLREQDLISENDLETSQQNFSNADSSFIRAQASLELARERLADATVTAPIAGTVLAKSVEQGQIIASSTNNVSGGTVLLTMADLSELEIRTLVDEIDIGNVSPGLRVESTVEAFAEMRFQGEVMKIEPLAEVQQSVTTFPVLSRIDNAAGLLLPGMNADVSIIIHERSGVLTIANEAVRSLAEGREVIRLLALDQPDARGAAAPVADGRPGRPASAERTRAAPDSNGQRAGRRGNAANGDALGSRGPRADDNGDNGDNGDAEGNGHTANGAPARGATSAAAPASRDDEPSDSGVKPAEGIVFLLGPGGEIVPREVVTGVRDWEVSEVLQGLEAGEELVLLPSTSLLRSQQSMRERYMRRNRMVPGSAASSAGR